MSRKKTKSTIKSKATKKVKKGSQSFSFKLAETMEKDFRGTPAKIIDQYNKDLATLRQQEKKLVTELKKAESKHKVAKNKTLALSKKASNKKQLMAAQKLEASLNKMVAELMQKHGGLKTLCKTAVQQQSKLSSLSKQMVQWEKEWQKEAMTAKKTKPMTAKPRVKKMIASAPQAELSETVLQPQPELMEAKEEETVEMN